MHSIPLIPLIGTLFWVAFCTFFIVTLLGKRKQGSFHPEHAFQTGGFIVLGLAPCIGLLEFTIGGELTFWGGGIHTLIAVTLFAAAYRSHIYRLDPESSFSGSTYREKSAMLVVATLLYVYFGYFIRVWNGTLEAAIPVFIGSVVLLVVIMIAGHIGIAIFHAPLDEVDQPVDERDQSIELLSSRNANYVITAGFWMVPFLIIAPVETFIAVNIWFALLVLSEIVRYGSVIVYYRWGEV